MSDYFCNISDFRNLALSRKKQASVQTLVAVNGFRRAYSFCSQPDWNIYGCYFADKPFIASGVNSRRNPRSNAYAWS